MRSETMPKSRPCCRPAENFHSLPVHLSATGGSIPPESNSVRFVLARRKRSIRASRSSGIYKSRLNALAAEHEENHEKTAFHNPGNNGRNDGLDERDGHRWSIIIIGDRNQHFWWRSLSGWRVAGCAVLIFGSPLQR